MRREHEDRAISIQLAVGFGSLASVAILLSLALLLLILHVGSTLEQVRADGATARQALSLSIFVREHYQHEAHTIIQRDDAEVAQHERWLERLQQRASEVAARVPEGHRQHLDVLVRESGALDRVFREEVLPAALAGDEARLREAHARAEDHTRRATDAADVVVCSLEEQVRQARARAQDETRFAVLAGSLGILSIMALAVLFSLRLRSAILGPLQHLAAAAERFGRGEFERPIGDVGRGEIRIVARAFDRMVEELRERERALLRNERLAVVGHLAANVAHEINNPIAVIRGYLKTMMPEARDEEQAAELAILDQEAAACQRIVEDLLSHGRDPTIQLERVSAARFLEEVRARFAATEEGRRVELRGEVEEAELSLDPSRLRQVLDNLLSNAAQHSERGGVVELRGALTGDGHYRIEVADRGPGIPAEERERVFEPFRTSRPGGMGLGLALSRVIVRAHRGRLEALPRADGGTVMRIDLPLPEENP